MKQPSSQTRLARPGVYDLPDAAYLADPVIDPSLNNSIAKLLVDYSPAHAFAAHPRLGGNEAPDEVTDEQRIGQASHAMFLRGVQIAKLIPFESYTLKGAKEARDTAIADGLIPLKPKQYDTANRMCEALEHFRRATGAFTAGKPEQTLVWREEPIWCRCKVDWLPDDPAAALWDLKTTGVSATPRSWGLRAFEHAADMQAAFYARGAECVRGEPPDGMYFCVVEANPPHGIRVFAFSPPALSLAEEKIRRAIQLWTECSQSGAWPSYPINPEWIDPPPWIVREWEGQQYQRQSGMQPIGTAISSVVRRMIETGNLAG